MKVDSTPLSSTRSPPAIPAHPVVRVVHPSGHLVGHEDALESGIHMLEGAGCKVRFDPQRSSESWRGYLAGPDERRLSEFNSALSESGVDLVWCARGGSGLNRIADQIIARACGLAPRCIVGYSDITAILTPLAQRASWTTFHGPVITSLTRAEPITSVIDCLSVMRGDLTSIAFEPQKGNGHHHGRLLGGNLTVLASMLGTSTTPLLEPRAVWLLEDVGETMYRLDRSFTQLVKSGLFDTSNCIWLGDLGLESSVKHAQMVEQIRKDAPCTVMWGAPAGHRGHLATLPIGRQVSIDFGAGRLSAMRNRVGHA